ncbi:sigma-70 family RNA polymerase sigma factor [Verrucomicrobiaceae bacterium 227]
MMEKGNELLIRYLTEKTEGNFRAIVREHSAMVHATAARRLNGDVHAAQDVSQKVFIRLSRSAPKLRGEINLAGWLYRQSCRLSADHVRTEVRRTRRESSAAPLIMKNDSENREQVLDEIDQALQELEADDREAIILRFLEERTHRNVGEHLGISEEAARKKCSRAIESLRTWFSQQGRATSTTVLVATLSGLAAPPLPAATVAGLSTASFSQGAGTALGGCLSFAGGAAIATLAVAGILTLQERSLARSSQNERAAQAVSSSRELPGFHNSSETGTMNQESLITQIQRLYLQPRNILTPMRIEALFDAFPQDQLPAFFQEADQSLTLNERIFSYLRLLDILMEDERQAAFDLILQMRIMKSLEYKELGFYERYFRIWVGEAPAEAEAWLRKNWSHEDLAVDAFKCTTRSYFAHKFILQELHDNGVSAAFKKAASFGGSDDFEENLKAITGNVWHPIDPKSAVEIFARIHALPDAASRARLTTDLLTNWKKNNGAHLLSSLAKMAPADRFEAALFTLDYRAPTSTKITSFVNGTSYHSPIRPDLNEDERAQLLQSREEALMATAREAGLDEQDSFHRILDHYFQKKDERAIDLFDQLPPGPESDEFILEGIKTFCTTRQRGSVKDEITAFNGALAISDPDLRIGTAKAVFRRIISKDQETALEMIAYPDFPEKLSTALQEVAQYHGL